MKLRWGIVSTGAIAHAFAKGLKTISSGELTATSSRSIDKAQEFAAEHGGKAYGDYAELLADPEVDGVYIATPHHMHCEQTILAAQAGKHILCEKPFTLNAYEAEMAIDAVKKADVFFMEAFMYRCHPQTQVIRKILAEGSIGRVRVVSATFGYNTKHSLDHFKQDGAVGGGGLMDVGCYCVSMCRLAAGTEPNGAHYRMQTNESGADIYGVGTLEFPNGVLASIRCATNAWMENTVHIYGEKGRIKITSPWFCKGAVELCPNGFEVPELPLIAVVDDLYGNEADCVARFLEERQCPYMSCDDTLGNMRTLDALRASAGLRFAAEQVPA